jgi:hypothetical protein
MKQFIFICSLFILACGNKKQEKQEQQVLSNTPNKVAENVPKVEPTIASKNSVNNEDGLERNPKKIRLSKHAQCRMDCRKITLDEIKEILAKGTINYKKSQLQNEACYKRYALEGISHDNQNIRLVLAQCNNITSIITVIDIGNHWKCNCPGDK